MKNKGKTKSGNLEREKVGFIKSARYPYSFAYRNDCPAIISHTRYTYIAGALSNNSWNFLPARGQPRLVHNLYANREINYATISRYSV